MAGRRAPGGSRRRPPARSLNPPWTRPTHLRSTSRRDEPPTGDDDRRPRRPRRRSRLGRGRRRSAVVDRAVVARATSSRSARHRSSTIDAALRAMERDTEIGGGVLAAAVGFRVFLFLVPYVFVWVGGLRRGEPGVEQVARGRGARRRHHRPDRPVARRLREVRASVSGVVALAVGLFALLLASRALVKTLAIVHVLVWGDVDRRKVSSTKGAARARRARDDRGPALGARRLAPRRVVRRRAVRDRAVHGRPVRPLARGVVAAPPRARTALVGAAAGRGGGGDRRRGAARRDRVLDQPRDRDARPTATARSGSRSPCSCGATCSAGSSSAATVANASVWRRNAARAAGAGRGAPDRERDVTSSADDDDRRVVLQPTGRERLDVVEERVRRSRGVRAVARRRRAGRAARVRTSRPRTGPR